VGVSYGQRISVTQLEKVPSGPENLQLGVDLEMELWEQGNVTVQDLIAAGSDNEEKRAHHSRSLGSFVNKFCHLAGFCYLIFGYPRLLTLVLLIYLAFYVKELYVA
jgi:hypothetical protein